ncbi:MAG: class I SAM-dependent methyltransferase [Acidobacteriota bacterium]|nr:class I SAM-dependent methyltransferase [Acidobacteriota bacterium]
MADLLQRLGYEVWIVDPYDGSGNGPSDFQLFSSECPKVRFIRDHFWEKLSQLRPSTFDCIYSISVLEHLGPAGLVSVTAGLGRFLKPEGTHLHAVDHVHRGNGADAHLSNLKLMAELFGLSIEELNRQLTQADTDTETYFLSIEGHNRWRGSLAYREFPMRKCISVQVFGKANSLQRS